MTRETESELRASQVVGRVLGRGLRRYELEPGGDASIDYIDEHDEAYEMKSVTSQEFRDMRSPRRQRWFSSEKLAMRWLVGLDAPTMDDKFRPVPDFPDDDPETIAAIEDAGLRVTPKADREAEWRERFSGKKLRVPRTGDDEARALENNLLVLEQARITNTRGAKPTTVEQLRALEQIRRLTNDAICMAHKPLDDGAGIEIAVGWGYVPTGEPDVFAFRVQGWLDSDLSANLRDSLRQSFARGHGVLTFDSSEPEYISAQEVGQAFVPTVELTLPPEVDVLWCLFDRVLLRYEDGQGWQSFEVSPPVAV